MIEEFNDEKFIPSKEFVESIDITRYPSLNLLRGNNIDGRLKNYNQIDNIQYYFDLIKKTPNKFLKLLYYENIKDYLEEKQQAKFLAKWKLIPLYYEVAVEIINQDIIRYNPAYLLEEYIRLSHRDKIPNQTLFDNIGNVLNILIKKKLDPFEILKKFLELDGKVLKSAIISYNIFDAINFYVNEIFDGNITLGFDFTDKIIRFYEKLDMRDEIETKRSIFATKFLNFFETKLENEKWEEDNMQSMSMKHHFLNLKLEVIQKYCPNRNELNNEIRLEIDRINNLIPNCTNGFFPLSGKGKIPSEEIKRLLQPFQNDSLEQFIKKTILFEYFLPDIPRDVGTISGFFPSIQFSNRSVKKLNGGNQINKQGTSDILAKWINYELDWHFRLFLFQRILGKFEKEDLISNIIAPVQYSNVINEISKRLFYNSIESYFNKNYFKCIQFSIFQIESILREICAKNYIETLSIEENKERQRSIGSLITKLKDIVSEKLLLLIKWLLLNEEGQISKNYRNEIAHGLDSMDQYNEIYTRENALSIILIYLSLSKY